MKKVLIFAAVAILMVIIGIGVYLYNSMDSIVENAIEKYGTQVMGTRVSVGSVDISLKTGRGTIRDVEVANPDGFSSGDLLKLTEITVDIDVKSLNRDPIVIDEVTISAPQVYAEVNAQAQSNVAAVRSAVEKHRTASVPPEQKQDGGFEKRLIIEKFVFEEGTVALDATALGIERVERIERELPPLRLNDVGGPNGDTPDAIGKTVSRAFLNSVTSVVANEVKDRAKDKAMEKVDEKVKKVVDDLFK